jgi:hypothetical protein
MATRNIRRKYKRNKKLGGTQKVRPKCSPAIEGQKINSESCLTKPLLSKAVFEGNRSIQVVMNECANDDKCVISKITDENKRKEIEETAFAPKQPSEWKLNINEWLSDTDILQVISQYVDAHNEFVFLGPSYIDFDYKLNAGECVENSLCTFSLSDYIKRGKTKIGIIFNLDDHTKSGSHWVSLYIDVKGKYMFYFDSAANPMPREVAVLIDRIKKQAKQMKMRFKVHANGTFEHQYSNTECGMYSLFFLITMLTNKYEDTMFKNIKHKITFFKRHRIPDKYVEQLRNEYFDP